MDYAAIVDNTTGTKLSRWTWNARQFYKHLNANPSAKNRAIILFTCTILALYLLNPFNSVGSGNGNLVPKDTPEDVLTTNMKTQHSEIIHLHNKLPSSTSSLRAQLAFHFPYDTYSPIPHNIFQTWKVSKTSPSFPKAFVGPLESWPEKNPDYAHTLITDDIIDEWVHQEFSNVPEVTKAWDLMPKFILKADFFRYLVIFARGGVYSDIDTVCLKGIDTWAMFDDQYLKPAGLSTDIDNIGFAVGIEADPDRPDWAEWYARRIQFVQWTIVGKRGHPFLRELISRIVEETFRKQDMGILNKIEGKDQGGDIMQWTGPGIFTDTLFDYLNNVSTDGAYGDGYGVGSNYYLEHEKYKLKSQEVDTHGMPLYADKMPINYKKFTGLDAPMIIDDVMILPITSFSPGVGQMGSKSPQHHMAFVLHTFNGSWKPEEERMRD